MRFVLLVEGRTERESAAAFLKRWLDPRLKEPVGIQAAAFDGYADLVLKMARKARAYLTGPKQGEIVAVIGLLDLYGPTFYPPGKLTANERAAWGKEHFERQVDLDRFRMFFAVHEFEAWLLSQPGVFPPAIQKGLPKKAAKSPEKVNFDEPPGKLLDRVYKKRTGRCYNKPVYGKQLFGKLDPQVAAASCPHLRAMLEEMLSLAKASGL